MDDDVAVAVAAAAVAVAEQHRLTFPMVVFVGVTVFREGNF